VHGGFRQAELSGNDAHAVTPSILLANFLAIDNHSRPAVLHFFLETFGFREYLHKGFADQLETNGWSAFQLQWV
jgi:hypothetical protein